MDELDQAVGPVGVQQIHQDPQAEDQRHDVGDDRDDRPGLIRAVAISRGHTFRIAGRRTVKPGRNPEGTRGGP
ncbi:hypothetical protein EASAB2608_01922 [Streptomyces sp. EAS-AB2608]|nr:hypothetical protein EASAB2608_01922 [Streptomyces sp. EAS-AB2608]